MRSLRTPALVIALGAAVLCAPPVRGDVVVLQDGTRLEGDLERTADGYNITSADGKTTRVTASQIKSLEIKPAAAPDDARKRLESLRKSVDKMTDLKAIVARYKDFLRRNAGTDAADDALADLKTWEDRLAKNMTKAGGKWVTAEELGAIQEESQTSARKARDLIAGGRLREAGPLLDQALSQDPKNPSAFYLRGVALFRQEQLGPARKAFDSVLQALPAHGPTLNNIAVILWKQDQTAASLKFYDNAMIAAPTDERILDNVAEALNALPKEHRETSNTKKVVAHFNERENALRKKMEKRGLYRWGATWVSGGDLDQLQAQEKEIEAKVQELQGQFDTAQDRLTQIDRDIQDTQRDLHRMELSSYTRDATGRTVRTALPRVYYDLQRDLGVLKQNRDDQARTIEELRRQAKSVKQQLKTPRYTGVQKIIDVEGTPLMPEAAQEPPAGGEAQAGGDAPGEGVGAGR